jgi:hypothetical protein
MQKNVYAAAVLGVDDGRRPGVRDEDVRAHGSWERQLVVRILS